MKKIITTLLCLSTIYSVKAADIYVNNSGQPGTWTTITLALAASAPGDRIFVSPYGAYTENLTILQDVTLTSAVSGTTVNVIGTLTITGTANMDVRIIGMEFSGACTANTGSAVLGSYADIYLIYCNFASTGTGITAYDFCRMHVLYCNMGSTINIRDGEIRGSEFLDLTITDGPNAGIGDTIYIVGNQFRRMTWSNDDNYMFIANNYVYYPGNTYCFYISKAHYNSVVNNTVVNNTFDSNSSTYAHSTVRFINTAGLNWSNCVFYNNILKDTQWSVTCGATVSTCAVTSANRPQFYYNNLSSASQAFYQNITGNVNGGVAIDASGRGTSAIQIDKGSPSLQYYDIDMTRNDIGTFGGPYSLDNYTATGTGNARVYDLNMPFEIWSGQTPQVEAEATHTK